MREIEAGAETEAERPDRRTGTRIVRALWLPMVLAVTATIGYAGAAMWADGLGEGAALPLGHALAAGQVADDSDGAHYWVASQPALVPGDAPLPSLTVKVTEIPGGVRIDIRGPAVSVPKPKAVEDDPRTAALAREPGRALVWQARRHAGRVAVGRDA
jgi:hypothetical protein